MASFTESPSKDIPPRIVSNQPARNGGRFSHRSSSTIPRMADTVPSYQRLSGNIKPERFFRLHQARFQMPFPESRSSSQAQQPKTGAAVLHSAACDPNATVLEFNLQQPRTLSNEYYHNYYVTQPAIELSQQAFFQQPQPVYHSLPDQKTVIYQVPQDHLQQGVYYQSTTRQPAEAPVYLRPYQEQNRSSNIPMVFQIQGEQYIHYQVQGRKTKKRHSKNHIQEVGDLTYVGLNSVANHLPGITTSALLPGVTKAAKPDSQVPTQMITANHQAEGVYLLSNEKITKFLRIDGQPTKLCHSQTLAGESASILAFVKGMTVEPKLEERSFNEICQNISQFPHAAKKEAAGANQKVEGSGNEIVQKVKPKQVECEVAPVTGGMTIFSRAAELVKLSNTPGDLLVRTMASPTDTEVKHDQELSREVNVLKGNTEESHAIWASEDLTLPDNLLEALFKIPGVLDIAVEMGYLPDVNSYCLVDPQLPGRSVSLGGTCMKVAVNTPNPSNFPNVQ